MTFEEIQGEITESGHLIRPLTIKTNKIYACYVYKKQVSKVIEMTASDKKNWLNDEYKFAIIMPQMYFVSFLEKTEGVMVSGYSSPNIEDVEIFRSGFLLASQEFLNG